MTKLTWILDPVTGAVLVRDPEGVPIEVRAHLTAYLGPGQELACAAPNDSDTDWPFPASAGAAVASAARQASSVSMSFIVLSFR